MAGKEKKERNTSPIGTACFVHVLEPYAHDKEKPAKYSVMMVFNEDQKAELKDMKKKCMAAAVASGKFGDKEKIKKSIASGKFKMPWRDAGEYDEYGPPFVEGSVMVNFSSKDEPGVVDRKAKPIIKKSDIYPGMEARVTYGIWPYDTNGNKGVTLFLNNLQKTGDGERLAGRADAEDDFDAMDGGDDNDDEDDDEDI